MNKFKKIIAIALSMVLSILVCGCGEQVIFKDAENPITDKIINEATTVSSGIVAENETFSLIWDSENVSIQLLNKKTGEKWSSTPLDSEGKYLEDVENIFSPIDIEYVLYSGYRSVVSTGKKDAIDKGSISSKKIEHGIEITFVFSEHKIAIPVSFMLNDSGLEASVNLKDIVEDRYDRKVFNITLLPYFCSTFNSTDNYLFVPSGSGSLMYTNERDNGQPRVFEDKVYGVDPTQEISEKQTSQANICMPVYGVKNGNSTLAAIITDGAEKSSIYAHAGSSALNCSYICNTFQIRGYNGAILEYGGVTGKKLVGQYTREMDDDSVISVQYSPSNSKDIQGYNFIANEYKKYLVDKYDLKKNNDNQILSLKILGGIQIKKQFFGVPYKKVESLTTFDETKKIISELSAYTKNLDVQLVGYGESGIDVGKIGGGFYYSEELGDDSSVKNLQKYCSDNSINLYYDYNLISFNKKGNGLSPSSDNSITANEYPAKMYDYSPVTGSMDKDGTVAAILNRSKVYDALKKAVKSTKEIGISGISLSSLSYIAYSDYTDGMKYSNCSLIDSDFEKCIKHIRNNNLSVATNTANDYAAALSDKIFDAPSNDGMSLAFDCTVPFYQIVYKGYINQSLDSINISTNSKKQFLKTIETGTALQYSLIANYKSDYAFYNHEDLQFMLYENNFKEIVDSLNKCEDYLNGVKDASIKEHILINRDVRKTVFDNGVTVYVNYGDKEYIDGELSVKSMDFKVG